MILLIDEDEVSNYINKELLECLNIAQEIHVINDGQKAFDFLVSNAKRFSKNNPVFVIFEPHISGMDGMELMESLSKINFIRDSKVVFMLLSVSSIQKDVAALRKFGVQEFAIKPLSEEKLTDIFSKYWKDGVVKDTKECPSGEKGL